MVYNIFGGRALPFVKRYGRYAIPYLSTAAHHVIRRSIDRAFSTRKQYRPRFKPKSKKFKRFNRRFNRRR